MWSRLPHPSTITGEFNEQGVSFNLAYLATSGLTRLGYPIDSQILSKWLRAENGMGRESALAFGYTFLELDLK